MWGSCGADGLAARTLPSPWAAWTARDPILQVEKRDPRGWRGEPQASVAQPHRACSALRSDQLEVRDNLTSNRVPSVR